MSSPKLSFLEKLHAGTLLRKARQGLRMLEEGIESTGSIYDNTHSLSFRSAVNVTSRSGTIQVVTYHTVAILSYITEQLEHEGYRIIGPYELMSNPLGWGIDIKLPGGMVGAVR